MSFEITSRSFENGASIPVEYTCDGDDTSPHILWDDAPKDTVTFALIMEDPDAPGGTFTHWIVYNIPSDVNGFDPVVPIVKNLDNGAIHGKNDFGKYGYRGPCPPKGEEHAYHFKLFALNRKLAPESAAKRDSFYEAIKGSILAEAEYVGKFRH